MVPNAGFTPYILHIVYMTYCKSEFYFSFTSEILFFLVTDHNYPSGHLERLQAVQRPQFQLNEICSQFPDSLPICCPFQHLHIWQRQDFSGSDASDQIEFKHGEFKVIMIEGVIYRCVIFS